MDALRYVLKCVLIFIAWGFLIISYNGGAMRSCATHYRIKLAHTLLAHDV